APDMPVVFRESLRLVYRGTMIYAGRYTLELAEYALRNGWTDLIGFGRPFVAIPDLPERLRHSWPLAAPDASRFFGGEAAGYTDYPIFTAQKARTPATAQETQ